MENKIEVETQWPRAESGRTSGKRGAHPATMPTFGLRRSGARWVRDTQRRRRWCASAHLLVRTGTCHVWLHGSPNGVEHSTATFGLAVAFFDQMSDPRKFVHGFFNSLTSRSGPRVDLCDSSDSKGWPRQLPNFPRQLKSFRRSTSAAITSLSMIPAISSGVTSSAKNEEFNASPERHFVSLVRRFVIACGACFIGELVTWFAGSR